MTYTITLVFLDGSKQEIILSKPHRLATNPTAAITYEDAEGNSHNIPLSSLRDFFFHPINYRLCEECTSTTLEKPTPNCSCPVCEQRKQKIQEVIGMKDK